MLTKLFDASGYAFAFLHEGMHWLAARAMGLKAKIVIKPKKHKAYTEVDHLYEWQVVVVALAPASFSLLLWLVGAKLLAVAWVAGCLYDFGQVATIIKSTLSR